MRSSSACAPSTASSRPRRSSSTDVRGLELVLDRATPKCSATDRFDIHRPVAPHVAFGSGPHACLGMHLARMEMRVALDAVLERLVGLRLDPSAPHPRTVGSAFRSPDALPVVFAPARDCV